MPKQKEPVGPDPSLGGFRNLTGNLEDFPKIPDLLGYFKILFRRLLKRKIDGEDPKIKKTTIIDLPSGQERPPRKAA